MADNKVNSGLLEFSEDQKVFVALDAETSEVKKAVTIDGDGVETDIQGVQPTGKKEITSTAEVDVASYATAQVVDEDLVAGNIKKDVDILGVVGSYEGGGSSDFNTATLSLNNSTSAPIEIYCALAVDGEDGDPDTADYKRVLLPGNNVEVNAILYKGSCLLNVGEAPVGATTGDITGDNGEYVITGNASITFNIVN